MGVLACRFGFGVWVEVSAITKVRRESVYEEEVLDFMRQEEKEESIYFNEQVGELNGVPPVFKKQPISESIYEEPVPLSLSRQVSRLSVSESPSSEIASIKTKLSSVRSSIDLFSMHPSSNLTTPSPTRVFLAARSRSAQHLFLLPQPNTRLTLARSSSVNSLEDFEADLFINPKEEQKK